MAMYVIYDRTSGKVMHTHVQPEDLPISREALLALIGPVPDSAKLGTMLVDHSQIELERPYRVDVTAGTLQPVDEKGATGFGTAGVTGPSRRWASGKIKIAHARREPGNPAKD